MNKIKTLLVLIVFSFLTYSGFAQNDIKTDTILAGTLFNKAIFFENSSNNDSALIYYQKASDLYFSLTKNSSLSGNFASSKYLTSLYKLSRTYLINNDNEHAFKIANDLILYGIRIFGEKNPDIASAYNILGVINERKGELDLAIENYLKALKLRNELFNGKHSDVSMSYRNIGLYYQRIGKYDLALENFQKALEIYKELFGEINNNVAISYNDLAETYRIKADYVLALKNFQKALEIFRDLYGNSNPDVAIMLNRIALVYEKREDFDLAIQYYKKCLYMRKDLFGIDNADVAQSYYSLGNLYYDLGIIDSALVNMKIALNIREKIFGLFRPEVAVTYEVLGFIYDKKGEFNAALSAQKKSLMIREKIYGDKNKNVAWSYYLIGQLYKHNKDYDSAIINYQKALSIRKELFGNIHEDVASLYTFLGWAYQDKGNYEVALNSLQEALNIKKSLYGEVHPEIASAYDDLGLLYEPFGRYELALKCFLTALNINKELFGEKHLDVANSLNYVGACYYDNGNYKLAIEYHLKALNIQKELLGENHLDLIYSYLSIGNVHNAIGEYDLAIEYFQKAIEIIKKAPGELKSELTPFYNNVGDVYRTKGEYELALQYLTKVVDILKETNEEMSSDIGMAYLNIGNIYLLKGDYNLGTQYYSKSLTIFKGIYGENHPDIAMAYLNMGESFRSLGQNDLALEYELKSAVVGRLFWGEIHPYMALIYQSVGTTYLQKGENDLSLIYFHKALSIQEKLYGETHPDFALLLNNLGLVYFKKKEYDLALNTYQKSLKISRDLMGENHPNLGLILGNIGLVYYNETKYDSALLYYQKSLAVYKEIAGEKNPNLTITYINIANLYFSKAEYNLALKYFHKGLISNSKSFSDSININSNPIIKDYFQPDAFLMCLLGKAVVYYNLSDLKASYSNLLLCDTLISVMRESTSTQSDKIALGGSASRISEGAIQLCIEMSDNPPEQFSKQDLLNQSFYFAEKNKAIVLIETLANQKNLKFGGIPDSLLLREKIYKVNIEEFKKKIAETRNSLNIDILQNRLFGLNRQYDELVSKFEKNYPDYYNLKFNVKKSSINDIQSILDEKTAIRSYFFGDSCIYIFNLTKNNLNIQEVKNILSLKDSISDLRYGLTKTSPRMQEKYRRLGYYLFKKLFPDIDSIDKKITNLILIPDGSLATLPFESLLTENYTGDINSYKEYPYLIKKYNISYSYSASLFYLTFSKEASTPITTTKLNDWLAFAPIFDNSSEQYMVMAPQDLQRQLNWLKTDSLMINRSMFDRDYITALPATKTETEAIFKLYDDNNLKAKVLLHNNANEKTIKSGELEKYKVLHFATHGFVNSERPELSGLLLAQDSTGGEDGILYSGEIYNLKLNANLVVLSACETGLGKIQKGEGIIGLTRAFLYAGAKNLIVSLWQVADESTSDLMVNFYKNNLESKDARSYSEALRDAKLKMINEGKFAHPLYWSPFILIGK